jgi:hypothetical protein
MKTKHMSSASVFMEVLPSLMLPYAVHTHTHTRLCMHCKYICMYVHAWKLWAPLILYFYITIVWTSYFQLYLQVMNVSPCLSHHLHFLSPKPHDRRNFTWEVNIESCLVNFIFLCWLYIIQDILLCMKYFLTQFTVFNTMNTM